MVHTGAGNGIAIQSQQTTAPYGAFARADAATSTAIGYLVVAESNHALAIGSQTQAIGEKTVAIGHLSTATGSESAAFGVNATAKGNGDIALGKHAIAQGGANGITGSAALGDEAKAIGAQSAAVGGKSTASGSHAVASGYNTHATGGSSSAIGDTAEASGNQSTAVGVSSEAKGNQSAALGMQAHAHGSGSIAAGVASQATQEGTTAIGGWTEAKAQKATAVGDSAHANANRATALGHDSQATGAFSTATGVSSRATGSSSVAIGHNSKALADNTITIGAGANATANATGSLVIGRGAVVNATDATVVGPVAQANGANATAVGRGAAANGTESTALGRGATATGNQTVALGQGAQAKVDSGVALGDSSVADRTARSQNGIVINISDPSQSKGFNTENSVYAPVRLVDDPNALDLIKNTIKGNKGAVSVGDSGNTRQIINVAAGSADSDAVNVAQLKAVAGAIKHYDVTSPNGDITVTHPNPEDPNKTVWNLNLNPDRVKEITKWKLRNVDKDGNAKASKTDALVKGDETVTFQDTDTIEVERVGTDGKTLKFSTKKNIKYFSVNSSGGTNEDNKGATGDNAIAIGKDAASSANNAVVIGKSATALKNNERYDLNVGTATSNADSAVVIGNSATSKQARTVAIGNEAQTLHTSAIAIGDKAYSNGARGIAIGRNAQSKGNNSIALGSGDQNDGKKTTADKDYAVAIGSDAVANIANGIALGSESKTTATSASGQSGFDASQEAEGVRKNKYNGLTGKNLTSNLAGLSIGNDGKTRQINHLAAGKADDDAVNVAQLKSVNLAFKGDNNTKGDVRLHDQRLSVVGATDSFITTKASDNKLEINTTKSNELQFTAGAANNITTPTGLTTDKAVANAINNSGWTLQAGDKTVGLINPGDKVNIASGKGITVTSTPEANNISKITINATVAGIKAGHNVTVDTDKNGISIINAIDTNTQASVSKLNDNSPITIDSTGTNAAGAKDYKLDVNVDDTTISKAGGTLHAVTGAIEEVTANGTGTNAPKKGQVQVKPNDENKVATVSNVANAINKAKWFAKADNNGGEIADNAKTNDADDGDGQAMGAGDKLTLKAGKNLRVKRDGANFTFATDNDVTFNKVTSNEFVVNPNGKFTVGSGATINMGNNIVGGVKTGVADTDAVNVAQLKSTERHITPTTYTYNDADKSVTLTYTDGNGNVVANTEAKIDLSGLASKIKDYSFKTNATGSNLAETGTETTVASGKSVNFAASDNLTLKQDVKDGNVTYTYGLKNQVVVGEKGTPGADGKPGKDGIDGSIGVNGKDGSAVAINGKDGSIGLNGENGKNGLTIKGQDGNVGVDGKDGETRLVYVEKAAPTKPGSTDKTHELATLEDGMKYGGDIGEVANVKLNKQVDVKGGVTDKTKLSDNNIGVVSTPNATTGGTELTVKLAKELKGLTSAEFKNGDDKTKTEITHNGITITPVNPVNGKTAVTLTDEGLNNGGNKITHVAEGTDDNDAVNVKQLKTFKDEVGGYGWNLSVNNGKDASKITKDTTVDLNNDDGNIKIAKNGSNVTLSLGPDVGLGKAGKDGKDGSLAVRGKDGASVEISGKDGSIGLTGPKGKDGTPGTSATITVEKGTTTVNDDRDGGKEVTRIVYTDKDKDGNDIKREVATLDDGLKFKGDSKEVINRKLGSQVNITGGADSTKLTENNIGVVYDKATNGLKVKLSKDVNLGDNGTITIGDTVVNKDGLTINGGPSITKGSVNAGNQSVTNVKDGVADNDAVNVKQLKAAKTEVEAGDHIDVTSTTGANGQTIYKVSAKGINDTSAAVKAGSNHVEVTKAANTHKDGSTTVTDYTVDLSKETKEDIKKGVDAHTEVTTKGLTFNADHGTTGVKKLGSKVAVNGDGKNITTTADENGVKVSMKDDIKVNSVTAKEVKVGDVNINENGINAGGKRITNVAPGKDGTDAVNVNQLKYVAGNISNQINNVDKGLRAGIAGALASGGLYHVTTAGKSMVSVGAGTYRGQNALAVGYSRLSDNGKVGVKFTVNSNSQGHAGASASVGYQW